jgi:HEAT repeat protein
MIPTVKAKESIAQLLNEFGRFDGAQSSQYIAELHVELLTSWQRLAPQDAVTASRAALASSNPQVRLTALRCWQRATDIPLSNTEYDLAQDPTPTVRVLLLQILAYRHDPRTFEFAQQLLNDQDLAVKIAALGALGEIKTEAGIQLLKRYQNDTGEIIRAAAYAALIKAGDPQASQLAMKDQSWRVRKTICDYLATRPHVDLAKQLLVDRSIEVRRAMLTALEQWPWETAAGLLLDTATNESPAIRQTAIQQLRDRWIAAAELSATASRERLQEQVAQLKVRLQRELGQVAEHLDQQVQQASNLLTVTDQELSKFSSRHQSWAKFLNRWNGANSVERRAALLELATAIHELPCEEQVYTELHTMLESEVDSNVWLAVIQLLANQHSPTVGTLLAIATSHQSPEVRKQSLDWYANHPHQQHQELLMNSLHDDQVTVVIAALKALAALPKLPSPEPILILLEARDPAIRVAAAYALAAHGINPGYAALIRLTYDNQPAIRRQATLLLGELGDIRALTELLRLLDDRPEIQSAALLSLKMLTGYDAATETRWQVQAGVIDPGQAASNVSIKAFSLTMPQQAKCWKIWSQHQNQRTHKSSE